ncbi:MAG: PAS domain S-box protein [Kofleriaceae bacterium]
MLERATKLSQVYYYSFELVDGDIANAKATFVNIWESLGYTTPPEVPTFAAALGLVVLPEDQPQAARDVHAALSGEAPMFQSEYRIRHADGSIHWNLARGIVLRDAAGKPTELIGTSIDITELKRIQERNELAIVGSKTAMWDVEVDITDIPNSRIHFTNVAEILGYDRADFPETWGAGMGYFHADDGPGMIDSIIATFQNGGREWERNMRMHHKSGAVMSFLMRGVVSRDANGTPVRFTGISIEITERQHLEEQLKLAKDRLELGLRSSGLGLFDIDLSATGPDRHTAINIVEPMGYDTADNSRSGELLLYEEDKPALGAHLHAYLTGKIDKYEIEIRHRHRDGGQHWMLARGLAIRGADGSSHRLIGCMVDITERKKVESRLREAEQRFRRTFETAAVGMVITDQTARIVACNSTFEQMFGYRLDELTHLTFAGMSVDSVEYEAHQFGELLAGRIEHFSVEKRYRRKDGSILCAHVTISAAMRDEHGHATEILGVMSDITERVAMEKTLRDAEQRFRRTFENAAVGMAITDPDANFIELNDRLCRFYGYPKEEAQHFRIEHRSLDGTDEERRKLREVVEGREETFTVDKRFRRKDGQIVWHQLTASATLRDESGRATEMLGIVQNITERKTLEIELQAAREAAESANRAKDQFLAHVSHEIRTPMNAVLGMTELAMDATGEHQRQLLQTARSAAGNLLEIINDLLDFSKIEAGKLSLHVTDFSLRALLADLLRALAPRAEAKGLALRHDLDPATPDVLRGDEGRLRQVLMNLLGNALKFTPKGEAHLEVRLVDCTPEHAVLAFAVRDTGIGIAPDKQETIFRAFEQGDASTTRTYGGTGLGLTISAQLADLMGGGITLSSEVGRGSRFVLTVPFAIGSAEAIVERRVEPPSTPRRTFVPRVLVAEDNELNVAVVREILNRRSCRAAYANTGRAALSLLDRNSYDLLLLDLHMPELDGFGVVRAIREREQATGGHLPIIALTARSGEKDREEALAAGMDDFLSKPIEVDALWSTIDRVLALYPPPPRPASLLDREVITRVSGGRADVFARLVGVLQNTLPGQIARGRTAFEEHDFDRLRDAAHRLHGTLAAFSSVAGEVALDLEDASTRSEATRCRELLGQLDQMSGQLLDVTRTLSYEDLDRL